MPRRIRMLKSWHWYDQDLVVGQTYEVGKTYHGHRLRDKNADSMISTGFAEEVQGDA